MKVWVVVGHRIWGPVFLVGALAACDAPGSAGESGANAVRFDHDGTRVEVEFEGEWAFEELFEDSQPFALQPLTEDGSIEGQPLDFTPSWLRFTYRIGPERRTVLVASRPVMNHVSWDAIARAGAALGNGASVVVAGVPHPQNARVRAADGSEYHVRLPGCGQSTLAHLSEWNLLIGGVHAGDQDFVGESYGWLAEPYTDEDLMVGFGGSLTWCRDDWRSEPGYRVLRGYFRVSRFHAAQSDTRTDRIVWRPVLELVESDEADLQRSRPMPARGGETSPHRDVRFLGVLRHEELFAGDWRLTDAVPLDMGVYVDEGRPSWLHFELDGRTLLVAASPVKHSLSWAAIAQAGAALGDGSVVQISGAGHVQRTEVSDRQGTRYRLRLLSCGESTMDPKSEWNRLIGGIHEGDGDFVASSDGRYGWVEHRMTNAELHIGELEGAATWCQERRVVRGREHAVNRGYLTVSRFHLTETGFRGYGFGWRPVLERIDDPIP
jgi:hypothetical protein